MNLPPVKGFKPYGRESAKSSPEPVNLLFEEYEALRLSDYDGLNHQEASAFMHVSRPTFTRIYAEALRKIAMAFVEGRPVIIEGGKVFFDSDWYHCTHCGCYFNHPEKDREVDRCSLCGSRQVARYEKDDPHLGKGSPPCGNENF